MSSPSLNRSMPSINRWVIAVAAIFLQIVLGAVYAWSVFLKPLAVRYFHVPTASLKAAQLSPTNLAFSITIVALGVVAGFGGVLQRRYGPRTVATVGGILYGLGIFLSGFAPNLGILYLTYGIISGIGAGLGYIVPIAMLLRWFPDRRGLITGLAVAGFGLGAAVTAPLAAQMIQALHVGPTLNYLGIADIIIAVIAAQFFRAAPENYTPAGWIAPTIVRATRTQRDYRLSEALRSPNWYILWLMLTLNVIAGAALISVAAPLAQEFVGVSAVAASLIVTTNSFFNAGGRLLWSWLSETITRPYTFLALFMLQIFAFILLMVLPHPVNYTALIIIEGIVVLCYGGGFGTMPAFTADAFGARNSGAIYGAMLTAWSVGSVIGPQLITLVQPRTTALLVIAVIMLISCALPFIARIFLRRQSGAEMVEVSVGGGK